MKTACVLLLAVAAAVCLTGASATKGVDVSSDVYIGDWKCLSENGYEFAVIRAWTSLGSADPNAPHTIYNAWDGGMKHVDVYLFPDTSGSPTDQFSGMINYLAGFGIYNNSTSPHAFGTVWLDIEAPDLWSSDQSVNRNFVQAMIDEAQRLGVRLGIYTSASQWIPIMGEWDGGSSFPLWYAHYDDNPSFSDFSPFGGWSSPSIKQYEGNLDVCGASIDADWYP